MVLSPIMLIWMIAGLLLFQPRVGGAVPAARIRQLLKTVSSTDDDRQEEAAIAELKEIFARYGLPSISEVGDEASYEFVYLTCSPGPDAFRNRVLRATVDAARKRQIPADAASYCAAHIRQENAKARAERTAPTNPALRDQIEALYRTDQAVRSKDGFSEEKMSEADAANGAALRGIFARYGVPTFRMVGPEASSDFVLMAQHQSPEFRKPVLPLLKANVDAGQADPGSYAMVFDRLQSDSRKKQLYGQNLICDSQHPKLHEGEIEDPDHVDERRASIGLMRLSLYVEAVIQTTPDVCSSAPEKQR
jgi:hypothetical protein